MNDLTTDHTDNTDKDRMERHPCRSRTQAFWSFVVAAHPWAAKFGGFMKIFWRGIAAGAAVILAAVLIILAFRFFYKRDKKIYEYLERQYEVQTRREAIINRDPDEFLDDPGVRRAADDGIERIRRKRDEIIQRERSTGDDR
jgi:hypothetical protein